MSYIGLNVLSEEEFGQGSGITEPGEHNVQDGKTIIVKAETPDNPEDAEELIQNFDKYNIIIKETEEDEAQLTRLEDVAQIITASETITNTQVQGYLNAASGNEEQSKEMSAEFSEDVAPIASFTSGPSQVNLPATQQYFVKKLDSVRDGMLARYKAFFYEERDEFFKSAELLIAQLDNAIEKQKNISLYAAKRLEAALKSNNYLAYAIVQVDKDKEEKVLVDIRYVPFRNNNFNSIVSFTLGVDSGIFSQVTEILDSPTGLELKALMRRVSGELNTNACMRTLKAYHTESAEYWNVSYVDLLCFFSSGKFIAYLEKARGDIFKEVQLVTAFADYIKDKDPASIATEDFEFEDYKLSPVGAVSRITSGIAIMAGFTEILAMLNSLTKLSRTIMNGFKEIIEDTEEVTD